MEDFMTDTTECPKCFSEGAYFNGLNYECPDCGFEWNNANDLTGEVYSDDSKQLEKYFEKLEESKSRDKINSNILREIYSPSYQYEKRNILYAEVGGVEDEFSSDIFSTLIKTRDYTKIIKIHPSKDLPKEIINKIVEQNICSYLASRDELPLYPTVSEWSNYINAPEEIIERILSKYKPHIIQELPHTDEGGLTVLFHKRIEKLFETLKSKKDFAQYGRFTLNETKEIFSNLANGDRSEDYSNNFLLEAEIAKNFSSELKAIRKYRKDIEKWKDGTLDIFLVEAKNKRLSKIDTVILILEFYFKEIMN